MDSIIFNLLLDARAAIARTVAGLGQAIMRLGHRIDECAFDGDEHTAWQNGWDMAAAHYATRRTTREDATRLLDRLGFDTSDDTLARLGF